MVGLGEALLELLPMLLGHVRELLELRMDLLLRRGCALAERRGRLLVCRVLVLGLGGRRGGDLLVRRLLCGLGLAVSLELGQLIARLCACASKVGSRERGRRRHEYVRSCTHLVGGLVARVRLAEHNRVGHVEVEGLLGSRARDESVGQDADDALCHLLVEVLDAGAQQPRELVVDRRERLALVASRVDKLGKKVSEAAAARTGWDRHYCERLDHRAEHCR